MGKNNGPLSKFKKEFYICIFYHLLFCHFDPISIFLIYGKYYFA